VKNARNRSLTVTAQYGTAGYIEVFTEPASVNERLHKRFFDGF
jgi:hypothetical protein